MTQDYYTALAAVPKIILSETHPIKFLPGSRGNIWSAAERLAKHWTMRRELFGEERWLRPLRLHEGGALYPEDLRILKTGFVSLNTPFASFTTNNQQHCEEPRHRQVLVLNFPCLEDIHTTGSCRRRLFYYFIATGANEYTLTHGFDTVSVIGGTGVRVKPDRGRMLLWVNLCGLARPWRILLVEDPSDKRRTLRKLFGVALRKMIAAFWSGHIFNVKANSPAETITLLQKQHGFDDPSTLPDIVGGTWTVKRFKSWLMQRCQEEMQYGPFFRNRSNIATQAANNSFTGSVTADATLAIGITASAWGVSNINFPTTDPPNSQTTTTTRTRRCNSTSRFAGLTHQDEDNPTHHHDDSAVSAHIGTDLISRVAETLPKRTRHPKDEESNKRRLAKNSKNYYERKKQRHMELEQEALALRGENSLLSTEHARLQDLWDQSMKIVQSHGMADTFGH